MEEAIALVNEAVDRARSMKLDSTLNVSLLRHIGDNQITFSVQVPPHGIDEAKERSLARQKERERSMDGHTVGITGATPLYSRSNTDMDAQVLAGSLISQRRESMMSESAAADEVQRLTSEIERLKRKALSRGVNLTSKDEDVPAEDVARLRSLFTLADSTGNGQINEKELQALHQALGEPLADDEAHDAFKRMDVNKSGEITFDDFLSWFTLAHSRSGILSKKGQAYSQRFKKLMAQIQGHFDLKSLSCSQSGEAGTLGYRMNFHYNDNGVLKRISPWHDIPLAATDGNLHFICEVSPAHLGHPSRNPSTSKDVHPTRPPPPAHRPPDCRFQSGRARSLRSLREKNSIPSSRTPRTASCASTTMATCSSTMEPSRRHGRCAIHNRTGPGRVSGGGGGRGARSCPSKVH